METTLDLEPKTIDGLQELIGVNLDAAEGFRTAADAVENPPLSDLFGELAAQRAGFANQLKDRVAWNGEEPRADGSLRAKLHRMWMDVRAKATDGAGYDMLAECERGEDRIKQKYEEVLVETAGSPLNALLTRQYADVKKAHDQVRDLRDSLKNLDG